MSPGHCSCPECGTTLRIRDRSFVGRQVDCPECQAKLVISQDAERNLIAERPREPEVKKPAAPKKLVAPVVQASSSVGRKFGDLVRSPLVIAWALGIGITSFVAIMMLRPAVRFRPPGDKPSPESVAKQNDPPSPVKEQNVKPLEVTPEGTSTTDANPTIPTQDSVADTRPQADVKPAEVPSAVDVANANPAATEKVTTPPPPIPVPARPVKIQVEDLFKQPIKGFATSTPKSRKELIELVEEMLGAPIRYNREELGDGLNRTMSISLESTTVGGILKVILDSAGWDYVVEDDGIRLKPRRVAEKGQ